MRANLLQFVVIFLFFQSNLGALHFNARKHPEDVIQRRSPRQNAEGSGTSPDTPESYSYHFTHDDHQYAQVNYLGKGSKVIFMLTFDVSSFDYITSSKLYRSTDDGQTFQPTAENVRIYRLSHAIYRFPDNNTVIFADELNSRIYVTFDEGETFKQITVPVNPTMLKVHPAMPGWLLGYNSLQKTLMYSVNFGMSWGTVAEDVESILHSDYSRYDFTWGEPGIDWDINNPSSSDLTKVFYSVIDPSVTSSSNNSRIIYVATNFGGGYTSSVFDNNLGYVYTFILDGSYIFADKYICDNRPEVQLYVSYMRNPFNSTRIPTTFSHYFYFVLSFRSSQALVIIQHYTHFSLYLSDETGTYYSLSLEDLVVGNNAIDLEIIDSINGTIMANQFVTPGRYNQTLISFDNGAQWHKIPAPAVVSSCKVPSCSLHFHMDSSEKYRRIGVYSRASAPGIIVAQGNTGSYLTDSSSVYISRDGGLNWEQTLDGTWHVETIDHGGLLVAAKDNHQDYSMTIRYSCNEGMSWRNFDFINRPIVVWGIATEPGETTTQVLLFGSQVKSASSYWIITHVNFTSIFNRTCEASDYEYWNMSDGRIKDQQCLLGEIRIIERRKPEVCCWNSRQYERVISTTPCECTAADFECEWGYYRDTDSSCILGTKYGSTSDCLTGYRKIAGDVCFGGVSDQYLPPSDCVLDDGNSARFIDCDSTSQNSKNGSVIAISVSIPLVIVIVTLIIVLCTLRFMTKMRKAESAAMPTTDGGAREPNKMEVVGGIMTYKSLKEEKADEI